MIDILAFDLEKVAKLLERTCDVFILEKDKDTHARLGSDELESVCVYAWNPERIASEDFSFEITRDWLQTVYDTTVSRDQWEFKLVIDGDSLTHPFCELRQSS